MRRHVFVHSSFSCRHLHPILRLVQGTRRIFISRNNNRLFPFSSLSIKLATKSVHQNMPRVLEMPNSESSRDSRILKAEIRQYGWTGHLTQSRSSWLTEGSHREATLATSKPSQTPISISLASEANDRVWRRGVEWCYVFYS